MTRRPCAANCYYYVEGRCRLKQQPVEKRHLCPYFDGQGMSRGMI
ncbi:MAG TPA: cleavage protein [Desulfitobacterium dehalogenans]|uniref:Cleavage protein n=1 Tax=Desulfitobacterium dehalogenans TaxID=36854 RepID=A0A7C6Z5C5_9FIRM|nr:cleavage protein [Desulfitobacterium dehalogenans]